MGNSTGAIVKNYSPEVETYFQIVVNFTTHYPFDSKKDYIIMKLHGEGHSYRSISKHLKREYGTKDMIACAASICNRMKVLREIMFEWDATHPDGLSYTRQLFEGYEDYED